MREKLLGILIFVLLSLSVILSQRTFEAQSTTTSLDVSKSKPDNINYTSVFDGKTLDGWQMAGKGNFEVVNNTIQSGGEGILWYKNKEFHNFILKLEWMVSTEDDNSGVFVRFPNLGNDPKIAVKKGYEIQIDDGAGNPIHHTGAIYDFSPPSKPLSLNSNEWNRMEINATDQSYTVFINGEKINEFTGDRLQEGHIGLQSHDEKSKVLFRNISIREFG
jgi:hypothetical protein